MRPLVAVRSAAAFRRDLLGEAFPLALAGEPLFWPLGRAARALSGYDDFPPVAAFARVFAGEPPVRFVSAAPRRRRGAPVDPRALYDARITLDREVPTRGRCWHDLMNVLVWGTFPRAKTALHARQHRAIAERLAPDARRLPPTRTPELDALALLDEGGVVLWSPETLSGGDEGAARPIVFGHAIYESLALDVAPAIVAGIALHVGPPKHATAMAAIAPAVHQHAQDRAAAESELLAAVDLALAAAIEDGTRLRTPTELRRVRIGRGPGANAVSSHPDGHPDGAAPTTADGGYCAP